MTGREACPTTAGARSLGKRLGELHDAATGRPRNAFRSGSGSACRSNLGRELLARLALWLRTCTAHYHPSFLPPTRVPTRCGRAGTHSRGFAGAVGPRGLLWSVVKISSSGHSGRAGWTHPSCRSWSSGSGAITTSMSPTASCSTTPRRPSPPAGCRPTRFPASSRPGRGDRSSSTRPRPAPGSSPAAGCAPASTT